MKWWWLLAITALQGSKVRKCKLPCLRSLTKFGIESVLQALVLLLLLRNVPRFSRYDSLLYSWEVKHHTLFISSWHKITVLTVCNLYLPWNASRWGQSSGPWAPNSTHPRKRWDLSLHYDPLFCIGQCRNGPGREIRGNCGPVCNPTGKIRASVLKGSLPLFKSINISYKKIPAQNRCSNILWLKLQGLLCLYHLLMQSCKVLLFSVSKLILTVEPNGIVDLREWTRNGLYLMNCLRSSHAKGTNCTWAPHMLLSDVILASNLHDWHFLSSLQICFLLFLVHSSPT